MADLIVSLCLSVSIFGMSDYRNKKACQYMPDIVSAAEKNNIDPNILVSLIFVESSFLKKVVSHAGACGLTQVIPKYTGGLWSGNKKYTCDQLKNPKTSIRVGAKILSWWIKYHKGDIERALCGYNAGFRCKGEKPIKGGMRYAKKVLRYSNILKNHSVTD